MGNHGTNSDKWFGSTNLAKSGTNHGEKLRELGKPSKKKTFFCDKCHTFGGEGLERVHVTKKTIASKSFLSNFKHF